MLRFSSYAIVAALTVAGSVCAGQPAEEKPEQIALAYVAFDKLKDWKFTEPAPLKFDGTLPLSGTNGKPVQGVITKDAVLISQAFAGRKPIKPGENWTVDVQYESKLVDKYVYRLEKDGEGFAVRGTQARLGSWRGKPLALVDSNSNGRFDDAGVDQIIYDKTTELKVGAELTLGTEDWMLKVNPAGSIVEIARNRDFATAMQTTDDSADGALLVWNLVRRSLKLEPITRDKELERIGMLHVKYMQKHGLEHAEEKSSPLYTDDGNKAGKGSVLSSGRSSARDATFSLLDTFYHRVAMIMPDVAVTGICYADGYAALNVQNGPKRKVNWAEPIAYPPDGATHVRPSWSGREGPSPIPEVPRGGVGQSITLTFPENIPVKNAKMVLKENGKTAVDAWVTTPEKPAQDGADMFPDNYNTICLIAKAPLKTKTEYKVEAEAEVDGKPYTKTWSFRTGESSRRR